MCHLLLKSLDIVVDLRDVGVVLELVEAPLHHVLRVDLLHPQQVEHHVVGEVEGGVEVVRLTLDDLSSSAGRYLLIHHQYHNTLVIQTSPACSS